MANATCKIDRLSDSTLESVRNVSRALWNARYRLEVACRIAEAGDGRVFAHGLASACKLSDKTIGEELRRLLTANLLRAVPISDPGQKRQYYDRVESCYWSAVTTLIDEIVERSAAVLSQATPLRPA
jgi:hypothetical protein